MKRLVTLSIIALILASVFLASRADAETLPVLSDGKAPQNLDEMWAGFDPGAEPLEVETLHEWEQDDVVLRVVRFRIGVFKETKAMLAAIYGFPKGGTDLPALVQIHGGGQYADYRACLMNAHRGYATVSIAWAGRISAPDYLVNPNGVQLFFQEKTEDPDYKLTTDWGEVDGYHAPSRNQGNQFPSVKPASWTLDEVESPRNSGWFLCALAARRALTFLEQQQEVDADRLGVYGHSMGGKLTVLSAIDPRVKAAAPSCGGISDRSNRSSLFRATLGDDVSLKQISCPIMFLSPANDFHGRIGDLPNAVDEIQSGDWRVTCSPHHNHQDTPPYEVATLLWFDQHLKGEFKMPATPESQLKLDAPGGIPVFTVRPGGAMPVESVDVYYTQQGKAGEEPSDHENTKHRFWHYAKPTQSDGNWTAALPLGCVDKPLWVYANVTYGLNEPVAGAGYYYGIYTAHQFNVSSVLKTVTAEQLQAAGAKATRKRSAMIEDFQGDWEKEWFTYKPDQWGRSTNKVHDPLYRAPDGSRLAFDVRSEQPNKLVVRINDHVAEVELSGGNDWQAVELTLDDFGEFDEAPLANWTNLRQLTLTATERLRPPRGDERPSRVVGGDWKGSPPSFSDLSWRVETP